MAVDPNLTRDILREEVASARAFGKNYEWIIIPDFPNCKVLVIMQAHTGDMYIIEITADDYKEKPPFFEFVDPDNGERGTPHAYPKSNDSLFHTSGPCICAPFSRKAYKEVVSTGPHGDWALGDWMRSTANNYDWSNVTTLADMLGLIQNRLSRSDLYQGRMG
jgi:hypothetical protein